MGDRKEKKTMNELHDELLRMRALVGTVGALNQKENNCKTQIQPAECEIKFKKEKMSKKWIFIVAALMIFVVITRCQEEVQMRYENDVIDDEFQWMMNDANDGKEYPGYKKDPSIAIKIYTYSIVKLIFTIAILIGVYFIIIKGINYFREKEINAANTRAARRNSEILENNKIIANEIYNTQQDKNEIYNEIAWNLQVWFPKDYCYLSAIDYFINQVENHMADTIQKAVEQYLSHMRDQRMNHKLDQIIDGIQVMISNQNIMISRQEEMIRQQIIGNCIGMSMKKDIQDNTKSVNNLNSTVSYTTNTYRSN